MHKIKTILTIALFNITHFNYSQTVNETTKNITGFNRIQTETGGWMDLQLVGNGSSFKIHDQTNGVNFVKWTAGTNYTEFLKEIRVNANITAVGSRNIYGFNRIQTPNEGWMDIQLAGTGSSFKIHDLTNGTNFVKWTAGTNYTEFLKDVIITSGKLAIGTTTTGSHKLAVDGSIGAREIKVETGTWSDFVFYKDYNLPTLKEVENHIKEKGHLQDIPSAKEVEENGINLGEMNAKLLQKIEELMLYTIQQEKKIENIEKENQQLKAISNRLDIIEKNLSLENK